ncbi:MAG: hypothetical protein CBE41_04120 [Gammaproteobacteria bacterium TMED281]|nr:MAG: hypothetical protein CBE41_04120 [Gammaproteobacteria bacterium TMED281]|tara:strand:- start:1092 stop:1955 length:864 start_codon:yes stop_codon:yes gene_type:complete
MYRIGIIGKGFVGSAVAHGFSNSVGYQADIRVYDKEKNKSLNTLTEVLDTDYVFVSVPTPSNPDGSINLKILEDCIEEINQSLENTNSKSPIILIRSTIVPGTSERIQNKYKNLKIVFNPEFLTERSANFDFISQTRFILGGEPENVEKVSELYKHRFGSSISIIETNFQSAELIKYVCNNYFAMKVSFLNEMKLVSDAVNANWDDVIEGFLRDGRVGSSHTQVPGPDGKFGFGGSCFPKDIQAMINFSKSLNIVPNVLIGAWETNLSLRPEKDWEELKGRAIVDDD